MARKKKKKKKSKKGLSAPKIQLAPGVAQEIVAVFLIAISVVLVVAFFDGGGIVVAKVFSGLKVLMGVTTYFLPAILLFIAFKLFKTEDDDFTFTTYLGLFLILITMSGLFHMGVAADDALTVARYGDGGGLFGYVMFNFMNFLFRNKGVSVVFLTVGLLAGIAMALNARLSLIFKYLRKLFERSSKNKADKSQEIEDQPSPVREMKVNANVPIASSSSQNSSFVSSAAKANSSKSSGKDSKEALMATDDSDWNYPKFEMLEDQKTEADPGDHKKNAEIIRTTLESFGIKVEMEEVNVGPRVTQYTLIPPKGVRLSKISALERELAQALAAQTVRIEAPIPGKSSVGIEVPNVKSATVTLRSIITSDAWSDTSSALGFCLGQDISGNPIVTSLESMPHLLVAGQTGAGKSVMLNSMLTSLLFRNSPSNLKLILVDPKQVEMNLYKDIPHLLSPVITDPEKCLSALKWAVEEMERRYNVLAEKNARNIFEFNKIKDEDSMPFIVIVIDELADLMMVAAKDVEGLIVRLAQKARATGIHLVLATQRPSVNVITGLIKANIPARVAFTTVSQVDSRTILDQSGAEKLLGQGDMLFSTPSMPKPKRIQGVFVSNKEVQSVTDHARMEKEPEYDEEILSQKVSVANGIMSSDDDEDEKYEDALRLVVDSQKASASMLQTHLSIGYARAARILLSLEENGIVGPQNGSKPRDVLISSINEIEGDSDEASESY